jgi:hypothetical protein
VKRLEAGGLRLGAWKKRVSSLKPLASVFLCLLPSACFTLACAVDERRAIPAGAQAVVEAVSEDIAEARDAKVYAEAAPEWRATVSEEESGRMLRRVRERLGRVRGRTLHTGREQQSATAPLSGHTLELVYRTQFERGDAMEKFTLLERDGGWLLAGYTVSSDALK